MKSIRRMSLVALSVVALVACGCTKMHYYSLKCVVRSAADGKPLEGVNAVVDTSGSGGNAVEEPSDSDGRLWHKISLTMGHSDFQQPHWLLKLEKDGFASERVDIKPGPEPKDTGNTETIFVVVYMRPKAAGK